MANQLSDLEQYCQLTEQAGLNVVSLPVNGIQVREERMCTVSAQRLYKLRCECGRSWFELECKKIVHCPACNSLGLVSE
jgi:hypothetical protein